jgi:conjugal transfer pilus assembly protein TraW
VKPARSTLRGAAMGMVVAALAAASPAEAKDLGVRGALFPILEGDLLDLIAAKLHAAKATGKLDALNKGFQARAMASVRRPAAVPGLVVTVTPRSWLHDPSFTIPRDYADQTGRVFAHAGDRINPLLRMPGFDRVMVFFDGDDARQLAFALKTLRRYGGERTRLILVKGSPIDLMRREKTPIYFDQLGLLTDKFRLKQIPAIIVREGERLRISEVAP